MAQQFDFEEDPLLSGPLFAHLENEADEVYEPYHHSSPNRCDSRNNSHMYEKYLHIKWWLFPTSLQEKKI